MREIDLTAVRTRLAALDNGPSWWRGLEELSDSDEFRQLLYREFPAGASEFDDPAGRRQFLKLMGASLALAGVTGCTRQPPEKIIPYVRQPEEIVPGRPLFFASAMPFAGAATPVLVESHMGRPTKIEPNPEHPATRGGTDVFSQAAVLTLYDPDRSQAVKALGDIAPWSAFLTAMQGPLNAQRALEGAGLRLVTESIVSPTLAEQIERFLAQYPQAKWIQWDGVPRDNVRAGARLAFGEYVEPQYRFDQAQVVLSLDADFLVTGPGRLRYARDFIDGRRLVDGHTTMNRLYVVESTPSGTGIRADHRLSVRAVDVESVARAVAAALGVAGAGGGALPSGVSTEWISSVAADLKAHGGKGIVLAGDVQPPAVHALAHAMNTALDNNGATVLYTAPVESRPQEHLAALAELANDMNAGAVDLLIIVDANPVFTAPADLRFAERMGKVQLRVHYGLFEDETAVECQWHVPATHFLESWGDARAFDGTVSICQPLIAPLYDGKSVLEVFSALNNQAGQTSYQLTRDFWQRAYTDRASNAWGPLNTPDGGAPASFDAFWRQVVHDGYIQGTSLATKTVSLRDGAVPAAPPPARQGLEVVFRPCPNVHDGRFANNGWLQEAPRPITKVSWENVAVVGYNTGKRLGVTTGYQVADVGTLTVGGQHVRLPIWVLPGHPDESVTVYLGYGRTRAGRVGNGVGVDVNRLRTTSAPLVAQDASLTVNGERVPVACTQAHFAIEGRNMVRTASLPHYEKEPAFAAHMAHVPPYEETLHGNEWKYEGNAWGMSIDLNSCVGCNACVVACVAENNIPVVGKDQVLRQREMHWLRIDRYYSGDPASPDMIYQPMMCQHCETAPCEVVCPVAATAHSDEGLNDMVYNRCVGTRYCSHNCPYKVRRFNFYLYSDWNTPTLKMVRNPDVTVRSRGVMEKCSYCVQRISQARIVAKREDRAIRDGEIVTACEAACPTTAIVFGNQNDAQSRVAKLKKEPRHYGVLADLNTRPRTTYLAQVRNVNPALAPAESVGGAHETEQH